MSEAWLAAEAGMRFAPRAAPATGGFTPWARCLEAAFPVPHAAEAEEEPLSPAAPVIDPEAIALDGFARGFDEGRRSIEGELAAERAALATLAASLDALRPEPPAALARLIGDTVGLLVRQIVGDVAVDPDLLRARAEAAAALVTDEARPARMRLHPDDLRRLDGADLPVDLIADPSLRPGSVVVECRDGWIEDGPTVALGRMQSQLDALAVPR